MSDAPTRCPHCAQALSFPADRRVVVRCPECGTEFEHDPEAGMLWRTAPEVAPEESVGGEPEWDPTRCRAINRKGAQCGNRPSKGSEYCRSHDSSPTRPRAPRQRQEQQKPRKGHTRGEPAADHSTISIVLGLVTLVSPFIGAMIGSIYYPVVSAPMALFGASILGAVLAGFIGSTGTDATGEAVDARAVFVPVGVALLVTALYGPIAYDAWEIERQWGQELLDRVGVRAPFLPPVPGSDDAGGTKNADGEAPPSGSAEGSVPTLQLTKGDPVPRVEQPTVDLERARAAVEAINAIARSRDVVATPLGSTFGSHLGGVELRGTILVVRLIPGSISNTGYQGEVAAEGSSLSIDRPAAGRGGFGAWGPWETEDIVAVDQAAGSTRPLPRYPFSWAAVNMSNMDGLGGHFADLIGALAGQVN